MENDILPLTTAHAIGPRCDCQSRPGASQKGNLEPKARRHTPQPASKHIRLSKGFAAITGMRFMHWALRSDWRVADGKEADRSWSSLLSEGRFRLHQAPYAISVLHLWSLLTYACTHKDDGFPCRAASELSHSAHCRVVYVALFPSHVRHFTMSGPQHNPAHQSRALA